MDYEQMEIDITLESDRDLKENMQATAKFALGQIMEYQHPTKVKNRHEGYGIAAEGFDLVYIGEYLFQITLRFISEETF